MTQRQLGYYWVVWTDMADIEVRQARPGPLLGRWDGKYWWFVRMEVSKFDCEVEVISDLLEPPLRVSESRQAFAARVAA